jgi:selenocysteine lyase/cysteine desulfurase
MEAGRAAVALKGQPWAIRPSHQAEQHERARRAAARVINADPDDVALIPSVSYGVATAGKLLQPPVGSRVLLLADDHSSPVLEWRTRAARQNFTVETVAAADDHNWTAALLQAIDRSGAPPVAVASVSSVHWSDGCAVDLDCVAVALRRHGAALLVDATHGAGVMPIDVKSLDPDFLVFPTYKWMLGPYGRAFLYIAKRRQDGEPLEQTAAARRAVSAEHKVYMRDTTYVDGARRFDMGECDHFISLEMASIGMELMAAWGSAAVVERLRMLTDQLVGALRNTGVQVPDAQVRAPHVLSLGFPSGMPEGLVDRLAAAQVYVAPRLGRLRISPHVYNDDLDVDRFVECFVRAVHD